jgi:hypothetical protein
MTMGLGSGYFSRLKFNGFDSPLSFSTLTTTGFLGGIRSPLLGTVVSALVSDHSKGASVTASQCTCFVVDELSKRFPLKFALSRLYPAEGFIEIRHGPFEAGPACFVHA